MRYIIALFCCFFIPSLVLVACGPHEKRRITDAEAARGHRADNNTTPDSAQGKNTPSTPSANKTESCNLDGCAYEFSGKNAQSEDCSTEKHSFQNISQLCIALKDEALNKNCAAEARTQLYQEKNCEMFTTATQKVIAPSSFTAPVTLSLGRSQDTETGVAVGFCVEDSEQTKGDTQGFYLPVGSQIVTVVPDDSSTNDDKHVITQKIHSCESEPVKSLDLRSDLAQDEEAEIIILKTNEKKQDYIHAQATGSQDMKSYLVTIQCIATPELVSLQDEANISIMPKSQILIHRDSNHVQRNGQNLSDKKAKVLYVCETANAASVN